MQREDQTDHGNGPGTNSSESAVNHLSKSVVRESRTPRSVGTGGGRPLPVTRAQGCNSPALLDSCRPQPPRRSRVGSGRRGAEAGPEGWRRLHSTDEASNNTGRRAGGGECGGKGRRKG